MTADDLAAAVGAAAAHELDIPHASSGPGEIAKGSESMQTFDLIEPVPIA
jgi:hypothetical protein